MIRLLICVSSLVILLWFWGCSPHTEPNNLSYASVPSSAFRLFHLHTLQGDIKGEDGTLYRLSAQYSAYSSVQSLDGQICSLKIQGPSANGDCAGNSSAQSFRILLTPLEEQASFTGSWGRITQIQGQARFLNGSSMRLQFFNNKPRNFSGTISIP